MKKIVLLGVGSTYFTKGIIESLMRYGGEWDLRLNDIDEHCLDIAKNLAFRLIDKYNAKIKISSAVDRRELLSDADAVVSTIGVGGRRAWEKDVFMFHQFDIHQSTGDTFGAGGVSRALRMIPALLDLVRDMEKLCPDALFVNFSNPMSCNCWALNKLSKIKTVGLCYGVTYLQHYLAKLAKIPFEETWTRAVGVNHFTWITEFRYQGKDAFPLIKEAISKNPDERAKNPHTWDLFEVFNAWPTVGDGHICEFIPGFQSKGAYFGKTFGIDGQHNFESYAKHWDDVFQDMEDQAYGKKPLEEQPDNKEGITFRDEDFFTEVVTAVLGEGKQVERTVNLPNRGIVTALPHDAILEITTLVNDSGFHPYAVGELPAGLYAMISRIVAAQQLTVEAALSGDRQLVVQALMADLTAPKKEKAEKIADCILSIHKDYLPQFYK
jgi:alpha-galactosidase